MGINSGFKGLKVKAVAVWRISDLQLVQPCVLWDVACFLRGTNCIFVSQISACLLKF